LELLLKLGILLKDKYKEIDLTIIQEDPFDSVNYIFKNGKWDKELE